METMKRNLFSLVLVIGMLVGCSFVAPSTAQAASASSILNAATLSPDHFLAEGSNDYYPELWEGYLYQSYLGVEFLPEDADALIVATIEEQTTSSMTTYEKVKALYDYLIETTEYGYGGMGNYCSVYSVLVEGIGTCQDYNYVMMAFLRYLGIDAALVEGQTSTTSGSYTGHAWVEAYIDGVTYVFDPQIDDNIAGGGTIGYYRFCKTYDEVSGKYILDDQTYTIYLASSYFDYYWYNTLTGSGTLGEAGLEEVTLDDLDFEIEGAVLSGWYYDEDLTEPVDLDATVRRDLLLWAGYSVSPFTDVPLGKYYAAAVSWAVENGITTGKTATTFDPTATCTRAQAVTFLYRAAGSPDVTGIENPFEDVSEDAYYYKAVLWAYSEGITTGTTSTTFSPNSTCSRKQIVTFLYRYFGSPDVSGLENPFDDVESGSYYYKAVLWAYSEGITTGTTSTTFSPSGNCLRSQIVTFLYRALAE